MALFPQECLFGNTPVREGPSCTCLVFSMSSISISLVVSLSASTSQCIFFDNMAPVFQLCHEFWQPLRDFHGASSWLERSMSLMSNEPNLY